MKNMSSFLASSNPGLTFSIVFTIVVVLMFLVFVLFLWWVDVKKKPLRELWITIKKGIGTFFDKVFGAFTVNRTVKTVYSDKSLNYSGTEFLPIPTKAPTDKFTYEFVGWDKNAVDQNGNFVVRAIYLQRVIKCYINVYDDDKTSLLKSFVVEYGAGVNLENLTPTKPETKEFSYEFVGWDKDITAFYGNTNVCAVYKAIPKKYSYTFFEEDGNTVISQGTALYGTPIIAPAAPQKEANGTDVYEFVGWKNYNEGMLLTKDCSFVATYAKREVDGEGQASIIKPDGTIVRGVKKLAQTAPAEKIAYVAKPEVKPQSFDTDKNEILHGSVGSQIIAQTEEKPVETVSVTAPVANLKDEPKVEEKPIQTHRVLDARTIIAQNQPDYDETVRIVPVETVDKNNENQKIQLVANKPTEKVKESKQEKVTSKVAVSGDEPENRVLQNMVVNHIKITPKGKK